MDASRKGSLTARDTATRWCRGLGVEIGAFKSPIPGIQPIYVDKFTNYANEPTHAQYFGEATELPFASESLDYVASSHVLEHTANPVKALNEWHRVLKPGGVVYMVVPDKRFTFDLPRETTSATHMIEDFLNGVDDTDPTHIEDFVYGINWSEFSPNDSPEEGKAKRDELAASYKWATAHQNIINIHFHVFTEQSLLDLINAVNESPSVPHCWTIEKTATRFPEETPNGILVVLRKRKPKLDLFALHRLMRKLALPNFPLLDSARAFPPDEEKVAVR